jgi:DNA-binding sugar fermentation-stimulating protein
MAVLVLEMFINFDCGEKMLSVSKISSYKTEVNLDGGRADFVLFHRDGGISIVEVKADNDLRSIASGIGQLFLYESMIPS